MACDSGAISQEDANAFTRFVDLTGTPSFNLYIMARNGQISHLSGDAGYQATMRVMEALGMDLIELSTKTACPMEEQFWGQFDGLCGLTEGGMRDELPNFITDPNNRVAVEALLAGRTDAAIAE